MLVHSAPRRRKPRDGGDDDNNRLQWHRGPGGFVDFGNGPLNLGGAAFTSDGTMFVIDPSYYGSPYPGGGFLTSDYNSPTDTITVGLPAGVTSGSFDFGGLFSGSFSGQMIVNGVTTDFSTTASIQDGFLDHIAFSSATPIGNVTLLLPDAPGYNAIDNFSYTITTTAVPEPATWAMMMVGFAALGFAAARRGLITG